MPGASAGGDHMRVGGGDVVQFVPDDCVWSAVEFPAEGAALHVALTQRAVREQQFRHARTVIQSPLAANSSSVSGPSRNNRRLSSPAAVTISSSPNRLAALLTRQTWAVTG